MHLPTPSASSRLEKALAATRLLFITAALLGATAFFAKWVDQFYPLKHWLFFRYVVIWCEVVGFGLACVTSGWRLLGRLTEKHIDAAERLALAMPAGILLFFFGAFAAGMFHLYGGWFFLFWPMALLAYGLPRFAVDVTALCRGSLSNVVRAVAPRTFLQLIAAVLLLAGLFGVYLQILNPNQIGYDARWYHMPVAEFYVAAGGIEPFREGWYLGTYPQLFNLLYVWAFEAPGTLFDHVLLCTHLEYLLFASTLFGVGVLAARLLRQNRLPYAAAFVFLFPQVFAYDSNLNGGADHALAFWAPAVGITLVRLGARFVHREATLAALMIAGAVLTKYQAAYLLVPSVLLVGVLAIRGRRWRVAAGYVGVLLLASAPHWAKNLAYYRDPFYPLLHDYLPLRPFHAGAAALMQDVYWPKAFSLQGSAHEKLTATLQALVSFSFVPHDWPEFHGMKPLFGSLFTLTLPLLVLMRSTRRLWLMVIGVHIGVAVWFVIGHEDRFLQVLVPWMAAATASIMTVAWQQGAIVRVALAALVVFQWAWGLDAYFIRTHNMLGDSAIHATTEFLGAAHRGERKAEQSLASAEERIAAELPEHAKVLLHRDRLRLGLAHQFVEDTPGWQGAIEYLDTDTPAATARLLRSLGVTHVMWVPRRDSLGRADMAREIVFTRAMAAYFERESVVDSWNVGKLTATPADGAHVDAPTMIAWLACDSDAPAGFYTPRGLANAKPTSPISAGQVTSAVDLSRVNAVVTRQRCASETQLMTDLSQSFTRAEPCGDMTIWIRNKTAPTTPNRL